MSPNPSSNPPIAFPTAASTGHPAPEDLVCYALQFFSAGEAAAIETHLERCANCRDELARIYSDLAACASTVDLSAPPAAARQRLIQQIAREKKIVAAPLAAAEAPAPVPTFSSGSLFAVEEPRPRRSATPVIFAVAGWLAAACLAVAAGFFYQTREAMRGNLVAQGALVQRLNANAATAHQLMDAITDPKAVRVTLVSRPQLRAQPIGGVTYNPDKGSLVFLASSLDPLQANKTYQLWVVPADGSAPVPAGTFHPDDHGDASVIMPDLPRGISAKAFAVTIENDGGSQTPTMPMILSGS